jgi:hypothetical protein
LQKFYPCRQGVDDLDAGGIILRRIIELDPKSNIGANCGDVDRIARTIANLRFNLNTLERRDLKSIVQRIIEIDIFPRR